ncbi:MAG: flavodoxin family protein [Saccharospirillum sp.]
MNIAIVYHAQDDLFRNLATSVFLGCAEDETVGVERLEISELDIIQGRYLNLTVLEQIAQMDAIIFGCRTVMGNVSAPFKAFADATCETACEQSWSGKLASGFTLDAHQAASSQGSAMAYIESFSRQHGMQWVGPIARKRRLFKSAIRHQLQRKLRLKNSLLQGISVDQRWARTLGASLVLRFKSEYRRLM